MGGAAANVISGAIRKIGNLCRLCGHIETDDLNTAGNDSQQHVISINRY